MKKTYKTNTVVFEKTLSILIDKYDHITDQLQDSLVAMAEELGYWKSFYHPERKKIQMKLDLYIEFYNDLIELQESLSDEEYN